MTDSGGQKLAYVYFEDEPGRRSALPKKVPQVKEEELCCGLRLPAPPLAIPCPPRNSHTLNLRLSAITLALFFPGRIGSSLCLAGTARSRHPTTAAQESGTYGGQGKAVGFLSRRLCCLSSLRPVHFDLDQRARVQSCGGIMRCPLL